MGRIESGVVMKWKRKIACALMGAIPACLSFNIGSFWRGLKDASDMSIYRIRVRSCLEMVYNELEFLEKGKDTAELRKYIKQSRMPLIEVLSRDTKEEPTHEFFLDWHVQHH